MAALQKCKQMARRCVYWPRITQDIEDTVLSCAVCCAHRRRQQKQPLLPHDVPERAWQKVAADLFAFKGRDYLLVVDYYSKFPFVMQLPNKSASSVINALKSIFAQHGIPNELFADNMPFASAEARSFANSWDFVITTSSPTYPQSNGQAERAIQTVKSLLKRAEESGGDPYIALLQYRNAPLSDLELSPAQLLYNRSLRTKLPVAPNDLKPHINDARDLLVDRQQRQKKNFDRHASPLPKLSTGDIVRVQHNEKLVRANVTAEHASPRSFIVETEHGARLRRNRRHLVKTREAPPIVQPPVEESAPGSRPPPSVKPVIMTSPTPQAAPTSGSSSSVTTGTTTRSGRVCRPPVRFNDYVMTRTIERRK